MFTYRHVTKKRKKGEMPMHLNKNMMYVNGFFFSCYNWMSRIKMHKLDKLGLAGYF